MFQYRFLFVFEIQRVFIFYKTPSLLVILVYDIQVSLYEVLLHAFNLAKLFLGHLFAFPINLTRHVSASQTSVT